MNLLRRTRTASALGIPRPMGLMLHRRKLLALLAFGVALPKSAKAGSKPLKIAYIALTPHEDAGFEAIFVERLKQMGYRQGDNLDVSYRSADGRAELLHDISIAAVADKPDILVAGFGTLAAKAAAAATKTIPVIFTCVGDPLGAGLIGDLAHPGGNVTGVSAQVGDLGGKRLQLLLELAPAVKSVGVLFNPETPFSILALNDILKSVGRGVNITKIETSAADQISSRIKAAQSGGVGALIVLEDPFTLNQRHYIVDIARNLQLPAIYGIRDFTEAGGLASYGPDLRQNFRRAADHYVESIVRGVKPGDIPVEQPTRFEFMLNADAARGIGITLPATVLAQADDIIGQ